MTQTQSIITQIKDLATFYQHVIRNLSSEAENLLLDVNLDTFGFIKENSRSE